MALTNLPGLTLKQTPPGLPGLIWETNFASDASYFDDNSSPSWDTGNTPTGITAVKCSPGSSGQEIEAQNTGGIGGSIAMRLRYSNTSQPTVSLIKHLTASRTTGYPELYIRYHVKLPNLFRASDGVASVPYWKWLRVWMNRNPTNPGSGNPGEWTENADLGDSFYIVANFGGNHVSGIDANVALGASSFDADAAARSNGSSGGPRCKADFNNGVSGLGSFERMPGWALEKSTNLGYFVNQAQTWHTVEYHMRVATANNAQDAVFEVWFDGEHQGAFSRLETLGDSTPGTPLSPSGVGGYYSGLPSEASPGWNWITFFDNMSVWNSRWGDANTEGYVDINDLCVATTRIGHNYVVTGDGS